MTLEKESVKLTSAMEDYLEAIYHLEQERRIARVRDIAQRLNVRMSSVSAALKTLGSRGLIKYDPHQFITLTPKGLSRAKEIVRNHEILKRFLTRILQIEESTSEDNACRIEHHLDPEVIEKLIRFVEMVELCPVEHIKRFEKYNKTCENCVPCLEEAMKKLNTRTQAQKDAMEAGLTLSEANQGDQLLVGSIFGTKDFREILSNDGIKIGAMVILEKLDPAAEFITLNINGYHVTISKKDAKKIFVKPI
ncbi:MAG: metal-dependent transcriptional regulator [Desulfomonilaceae bacterium]